MNRFNLQQHIHSKLSLQFSVASKYLKLSLVVAEQRAGPVHGLVPLGDHHRGEAVRRSDGRHHVRLNRMDPRRAVGGIDQSGES